jgi:SAM-dependent methyltransferase
MIERARQLTAAAGLPTFPDRSFDVAISRFGTMFFAHPVAAFANIARALRPGGRLVMMVWREHEANEWSVLIEQALAAGPDPPATAPTQPGPFGLADATRTERMLAAAGFVEASFTDVHEPVYYGPDVPAALEWIRGFSSVTEALERMDPASAEGALERLRQALAAHVSADGVWLDSRAWLVAARRLPP